ncbi:MAG: hypothetical protein H8D94_00020, partial [Candidatus Pelagibacter sp.]|nr:hypothetical protein [Candidatus Pelagibacter sp.]
VAVDDSTEFLPKICYTGGIASVSHDFHWQYPDGECIIRFTLEGAEGGVLANFTNSNGTPTDIGYINQGFSGDVVDDVTWVYTTGFWGGVNTLQKTTCTTGNNTITITSPTGGTDCVYLRHVRVEKVDGICDDGSLCGITTIESDGSYNVDGWGVIVDHSLSSFLDTNQADCIKYGHCNPIDGEGKSSLTRAGMISYDYKVYIDLEDSSNILVPGQEVDNILFQGQPNDVLDLIERWVNDPDKEYRVVGSRNPDNQCCTTGIDCVEELQTRFNINYLNLPIDKFNQINVSTDWDLNPDNYATGSLSAIKWSGDDAINRNPINNAPVVRFEADDGSTRTTIYYDHYSTIDYGTNVILDEYSSDRQYTLSVYVKTDSVNDINVSGYLGSYNEPAGTGGSFLEYTNPLNPLSVNAADGWKLLTFNPISPDSSNTGPNLNWKFDTTVGTFGSSKIWLSSPMMSIGTNANPFTGNVPYDSTYNELTIFNGTDYEPVPYPSPSLFGDETLLINASVLNYPISFCIEDKILVDAARGFGSDTYNARIVSNLVDGYIDVDEFEPYIDGWTFEYKDPIQFYLDSLLTFSETYLKLSVARAFAEGKNVGGDQFGVESTRKDLPAILITLIGVNPPHIHFTDYIDESHPQVGVQNQELVIYNNTAEPNDISHIDYLNEEGNSSDDFGVYAIGSIDFTSFEPKEDQLLQTQVTVTGVPISNYFSPQITNNDDQTISYVWDNLIEAINSFVDSNGETPYTAELSPTSYQDPSSNIKVVIIKANKVGSKYNGILNWGVNPESVYSQPTFNNIINGEEYPILHLYEDFGSFTIEVAASDINPLSMIELSATVSDTSKISVEVLGEEA